MSTNIEWITGPVHTGKTTRLAARIAKAPEKYCGLLAPIDTEGNRYLHDILSGERRMLDCPPEAKDAVFVGPYVFSEAVFSWGRSVLLAHHQAYPNRTLVIDEIGKLELRGAGLAETCWKVLDARQKRIFPALIIVRETLSKRVKQKLAQ